MRTLASFRNVHQGATIIVCGCGESLNDLAHPEQCLTIGVNDIGRRFHPNYLVVVNPRHQFSGDRFRYVETSQAEYLFTQLDLGVAHPNVVKFRLGKRGGTDCADPNVLHYTQNSPYVALCLAVHMGAKRIGLIGVDFTDHHFFAKTGTHPLTRQLTTIDTQYRHLGDALQTCGVEVVNLSRESRLTALPKMPVEAFVALAQPSPSSSKKDVQLRVVSYATTPVAGVPAILARCISARSPASGRCVWAQKGYGNGVVFEGDIQWKESPAKAEAVLAEADVVIVHNGKVEPRHRSLLADKAIITMAHNYMWNVDQNFVQQGFPGVVVGQYQATLPEFKDWTVVPNPLPWWEPAFQPGQKEQVVTICYTPSGKHERYSPGHRLYWHAKGYETTMRVLERLATRFPLQLEVIRNRQVSHAEALAMKRRAHIVIDECVTGSYHRNSLEGLATGCVVVNGVGLLPAVVEVLRHCTGGALSMPFVHASLDTLESVLITLIENETKTLVADGVSNRQWLEQHWDFARQWEQCWTPVIEQALQHIGRKGSSRLAVYHSGPTIDTAPAPAEPERMPSAEGVSVIITHGGQERLPLLLATLNNLRKCRRVSEIIVVEMDDAPFAEAVIRCWADKYLFVHNQGVFHKTRAMNVGIPLVEHDLFLWLDNDLIIPTDFLDKAVAELQARRLDCLVPWTSVRYLSAQDSDAVIDGSRCVADCQPMQTYISRRACGAAALVRKAFVQQYGGMCEDFRGWGGEDNAWFHKVRVLGRVAVTTRHDQHLYHLFHESSGGYGSQDHMAKNPHYAQNVTLLNSMRSITNSAEFLRRFPPPSHASCPWPPHTRIMFARDNRELALDRFAEQSARVLDDVYGTAVDWYRAASKDSVGPTQWTDETPDTVVCFGAKLAVQLLRDPSYKHLWARTLVVHDTESMHLSEEEQRRLRHARSHLTLEGAVAQVLMQVDLHPWEWTGDLARAGDAKRAAMALVQSLSFILADTHVGCLSEHNVKAVSFTAQRDIPEEHSRQIITEMRESVEEQVPMASTNNCRITVSIPYFQCKPYIRRAVESILAQTHMDLTIVVVNDGDEEPPWDELIHIDDPRLIRFDLKSNHGRYFADALVLEATADPYFMVQDADDWSEPQRIATLLRQLRAEHACGASSAQTDHDLAHPHRTDRVARTHDLQVPLDAKFKLRMRHHGLYRTDALRAIGGCYGGFRIAYDMLLINLLLMTGRLVFVDQRLYHRTVHADSLSMSSATGMRSAVRQQVTAQLGQLYAEALTFYNAYLAGNLEHADLCAAIQRLCGRHITPEDQAALQEESRRLREHLATTMRAIPAPPTLRRRAFASTLIADPRLCWSGWAIGEAVAFELQQYLESARPQRILELGSGMATVLLADYVARHQATLVSLSHDTDDYAQASRLLQEFDLRAHVDLRLAPLQPLQCPNGHRYPWYATDLRGPFDFVFIDGPPLRHGRQAAFFAIAPHLAERWVAWLHDAARDHEQQCVALWRRYFVFKQVLTHPEPRGLFKLSASDCLTVPDRTASGLGISLLTGGRLGLLQRTIATLRAQSPNLLEQCLVVALVNGDDPQTRAYLEKLPFVDQCLQYSENILPIGDATSQLMQTLLTKGVEMILHLEDDWETSTTDPDWLQRAQNLLRTHPEVGQIRLRHSSERVLSYHMVTQQPIRWEHHDGFMQAPSAHYTFNPSLIRACEVPKIFPCRSEHEAQVNFLRLGAASVQLLPGIFYHIGAHQSRRRGHGQT